jgi:hypothetical protein
MSTTTASDYVIWIKHIHGNARLAAAIAGMAPGDTITLRVDGHEGVWRKMEDGKDGRPTSGIRPVGPAQDHWRQLFRTARGKVVHIEPVDGAAGGGVAGAPEPYVARAAAARFVRTDAERQAALAALLEGASRGWRSDGAALTRDEMHER